MPYQKLLISLLTILILLMGANLVVSLIQLTQPAEPIAVVQTQDEVTPTPTSVSECDATRACNGDFTCVDGACVAVPMDPKFFNGTAVTFSYPSSWYTKTQDVDGNPFFARTYFHNKPIYLNDGEAFFPLMIEHFAPDLHLPPEAYLWGEIREKGTLIDKDQNVYFLKGIQEMGGIPYEAYLHIGEEQSVIVYALLKDLDDESWEDTWQEIKKTIQWK